MKDFFSPGSLVTIAGGVLTVIGATAYATGSANLSLPTIFYGIPILLGGLALKSSELPPAIRVTPIKTFQKEREAAAPELGNSKQVWASSGRHKILEWQLLAAGLGKSRQV